MALCTHRILCIEDCDEDFAMIETGVRKSGIPATIDRLKDAVGLKRWMQDAHPEMTLILMDLNLPGVSGHEAIRQLRGFEKSRLVPMVVLSSSQNYSDIRQAYEAGANSYHAKPLAPPDFYETVKQIASYWCDYAIAGKGRHA